MGIVKGVVVEVKGVDIYKGWIGYDLKMENVGVSWIKLIKVIFLLSKLIRWKSKKTTDALPNKFQVIYL